jgi:hypothetical protein
MHHAGLGAVLRAGRSCVEGLALGGDLGQKGRQRRQVPLRRPLDDLDDYADHDPSPLAQCPATTTNPLSTISHIASPFDECAPL